ncbi:hypothetical protein E2C01_055102 [Portunus trituberculatus]|uniref:Uncharacterized protein n=1 Tax=Portunus trituberculatus TaxID=210409 RepID=A0A5B7GTX2_PORTR|nr:hypothetical protein [Portunus trituberculatus]
MGHKMHFSPKKYQEMSLCPMGPRFNIEAMVGGSKIKLQTSLHM